MSIHPFLNSERQLRNGWWIVLFFVVLASLLVPLILLAQQSGKEITMGAQAGIIAVASCVGQWLRRKPLAELLGTFNVRWGKEFLLGGLIGSALMLIPAFILGVFGWVNWQWNPTGFSALSSSALLFFGVAVAEELLFRGFVFQRLISGVGQSPAQWIIAGVPEWITGGRFGLEASIFGLIAVGVTLVLLYRGISKPEL